MRLIYSTEYTIYDAAARANRVYKTWVSGARHQKLTRTGVERILRKDYPSAQVTQIQRFVDSRFN